MSKYLFFFIVGIITFCSAQKFFRNDYTYVEEQKAFFKSHKIKQKFTDGVATCRAESSQMYYPKSYKEWTNVIDKAIPAYVNTLWVGAHDIFSEGEFVLLDGTPIEKAHLDWWEFEPSNYNGDENCVASLRDGSQNDYICTEKAYFICKKDEATVNENPDCETYDTDYTYAPHLNCCYKFHKIPMKWREAYKICKYEQSNMVIINSKEEADYLVEQFTKFSELELKGNFRKNYIHVGFNDLINHGSYFTTDGRSLSDSGYEVWAPGQPDNQDGIEHCGSMFRNGGLNDAQCGLRAMFVCERTLSNKQNSLKITPLQTTTNNNVVQLGTTNVTMSFAKLPDE